MTKLDGGYNERLFGAGGLRSYLHNARYHWVRSAIARHGVDCSRVIELGCFDAKVLDWLPVKPNSYHGFDANWEGGLDIGKARYAGDSSVLLSEITEPREFRPAFSATLALSMETLEHVPLDFLDGYLAAMKDSTKGHVLFTVPNEIGPVFAAKHLAKRLRYGDAEDYTLREYFFQSIGATRWVNRNQHKGFNYREFVRAVSRHFSVMEVSGIPGITRFPVLSFGVGVVGLSRA